MQVVSQTSIQKNNTLTAVVKNTIATEISHMSDKRVQLDTKIEREVHRLVHAISEGVYDRMQIYVRKNDIPVEPEVLTHLLKTVQVVISEFELKNLDTLHANIKSQLDDYVGDENPIVLAPPLAVATVGGTPKKRR